MQSFVRLTLDPWQDSPPLLGGGLLQDLVLIFPVARTSPEQRQSVHGPQVDQPPFTLTKLVFSIYYLITL